MFLQKYTNDFAELIHHYQLTEEQLLYTGTPEMPIKIAQTNHFIHPVLAIEQGQLTNFFVLDQKKDVALYTTNERALLLRTFSTDQRYQGQGHAKEALRLLPDFIQLHFPKANEVILAVNTQNKPAQRLYEKAGFHYLDKTVQGEFGPLYIMSKKINQKREGDDLNEKNHRK
ncbi:GNAT family N-acetyltransferase [Candidatus Enterococcus mansonii]|nr:GNAT family protein [Enterococcus sp. 4G2_DIV0659]